MNQRRCAQGFSLIEIAIGLAIVAALAAGIVGALSQSNEQRRIVETREQLAQAREALLAFVATNGRLPCPAVGAGGLESVASTAGGVTTCTAERGFLPAVTLGLADLDANGMATNAWRDGAGNTGGTFLRALRYSVAALDAPLAWSITSPSLGAPGSSTRRQDVQQAVALGQALFVCRSSAGLAGPPSRCGVPLNSLAANAAAIVWSLGPNATDPAAQSADETANALGSAPRVVISRDAAPAGAGGGGSFDDQVTWIAWPLVADRLLSGGHVQ